MAALRQIDDRQTAMSESDPLSDGGVGYVDTFIVGPSMGDPRQH